MRIAWKGLESRKPVREQTLDTYYYLLQIGCRDSTLNCIFEDFLYNCIQFVYSMFVAKYHHSDDLGRNRTRDLSITIVQRSNH